MIAKILQILWQFIFMFSRVSVFLFLSQIEIIFRFYVVYYVFFLCVFS